MEKKISFEKATLILLISQKPVRQYRKSYREEHRWGEGWQSNLEFSSDQDKSHRNHRHSF